MTDWMEFAGALDIGELVPESFARYRQAVVDGLMTFLESLPEEQTAAILFDQMSLGEDADAGARLVAIARHCPALHKLAQVLARDRRLPAELRRHLQTLETMPPSHDLDWVRGEIESEIGALAPLGVSLHDRPLAEASVAVVVAFEWRSGDGAPPRSGVFKILKPGIEATLERELDVLQEIGAVLDERCRDYGLPPIAYEESFAQVRELLRREVHLDIEQRNLREARTLYARCDAAIVPEVFPLSTPRLTAMERIDGGKVTDVAHLADGERKRLAAAAVKALIALPLWSGNRQSLFHADPHAGNLIVTEEGRIGLIDWSLVGRLSKHECVCLTQILIGALSIDGARIAAAIGALGEAEGEDATAALRPLVDDALADIRAGGWPGLDWLTGLMDASATAGGIRFGANLIVFRKVLQTLQGVIADIADDAGVDAALAGAFASHLAGEGLARTIARPFARGFATHMSNADLCHLVASAPLLVWRMWFGWASPRLARAAGAAS